MAALKVKKGAVQRQKEGYKTVKKRATNSPKEEREGCPK